MQNNFFARNNQSSVKSSNSRAKIFDQFQQSSVQSNAQALTSQAATGDSRIDLFATNSQTAVSEVNESVSIRLKDSDKIGKFSLYGSRVDLKEVITFFTKDDDTSKYKVFETGTTKSRQTLFHLKAVGDSKLTED